MKRIESMKTPIDEAAISVKNIEFGWKPESIDLRIDYAEILAGQSIFLVGPSGSGKSTLLSLLSGVLVPTTGSLEILGTDISRMPASKLDRFRADNLGVIFQLFNLVPYLSSKDNILLPCKFSKTRHDQTISEHGSLEQAAINILSNLGMPHQKYWDQPVTDLSVGQQQRVAAARAFIGNPPLILADEPTSSLDETSKNQFIDTLIDQCRRTNATLLFVSHDTSLSHHFDTTLHIEDLKS
jgi:putative ABC transport system ATP-binding protein